LNGEEVRRSSTNCPFDGATFYAGDGSGGSNGSPGGIRGVGGIIGGLGENILLPSGPYRGAKNSSV
jgi:hypothetical protein